MKNKSEADVDFGLSVINVAAAQAAGANRGTNPSWVPFELFGDHQTEGGPPTSIMHCHRAASVCGVLFRNYFELRRYHDAETKPILIGWVERMYE